ncbi:MAG TPA: hypothetical protein VNF07_11830 [Acidimicrobiales bacterium]|nr:hypothetical protein [Acidimicrobiales bacterium]
MAERRPAARAREGLVAERDFLLRSIEDLELEHRAGDVDDADFATLQAGYRERLAAAEEALAATPAAAPAHGGPRPSAAARLRRRLGRTATRRLLAGGAVACFLGLLVVVALLVAGVRLPGESATGTVNLPANEATAEELSQALVLGNEGQFSQAVSLYDTVLARQPGELEARTYRAWLIRLIGIAGGARDEVRSGDAGLDAVAREHPGYAPARGFLGLADLQDRAEPAAAAGEFAAFLADSPARPLAESLAPEIAVAYREAHRSPPAALAGLLASVTTTTSTR